MNKDQQNIIWACLPKEERNKIITTYFCKGESCQEFNRGYVCALLEIFGKHNLTSDTEPEEMLCVERKKILSLYEEQRNFREQKFSGTWKDCEVRNVISRALREIFGNKCLPDKEDEPNYKFSLGQKVILHFYGGEKGTISERMPPQDGNVWNCYKVKELPYHLWHENELEPYTDSTNFVRLADEPENSDDGVSTTTTTETMEEKELNLCNILNGCEGMEIFNVEIGEDRILEVTNSLIRCSNNGSGMVYMGDSVCFYPSGSALFYPSRESYIKYPLDALKAWQEWEEARDSKYRIRLKVFIGKLEDATDKHVYCSLGCTFETEEIAKSAAEDIRKYFQYRFIEQNDK